MFHALRRNKLLSKFHENILRAIRSLPKEFEQLPLVGSLRKVAIDCWDIHLRVMTKLHRAPSRGQPFQGYVRHHGNGDQIRDRGLDVAR